MKLHIKREYIYTAIQQISAHEQMQQVIQQTLNPPSSHPPSSSSHPPPSHASMSVDDRSSVTTIQPPHHPPPSHPPPHHPPQSHPPPSHPPQSHPYSFTHHSISHPPSSHAPQIPSVPRATIHTARLRTFNQLGTQQINQICSQHGIPIPNYIEPVDMEITISNVNNYSEIQTTAYSPKYLSKTVARS